MTGIVKIPIPSDSEGINLEYLSDRIQKGDKAFLIAEPEIGLSGITMSMKKRRELYSLCYANGIPIVEIDQYREYHSPALPPIKALDKHGIVFYISEFTSLFCGSVTAGWIAATPELIERLSYVLLSLSFIYEVLPHEAMYEMLISGDYRKYVTKLQSMMRERKEILNNLLEEHIGDIAVWNGNADTFFWLKFKDYIDVSSIVNNKEGLTLSEYNKYTFAENNSVFVSLTGIELASLHEAIKLLSYLAKKSIKK
jgi:GntR family transcriptional regulator of abcA and norABC